MNMQFHPVRVSDTIKMEIATNAEATDELSKLIARGSFGFTLGYQMCFSLMRPGFTVLDLGAHIGTFSLAAAALGCRVVAVEASPENASLLQASAERNRFDRITLIQKAVSDHPGVVRFFEGGPYGFVADPSHPGAIEVPAGTVDDLLAEVGLPTVDLIKLDIEGSEVAALRGMSRLLARNDAPPILYESNGHMLHRFGVTTNELRRVVEAFGYHNYLVEGDQLLPVDSSDFQAEVVVDYLAVKTLPEALKARVTRQPLSARQNIDRALAEAVHPLPEMRAYIARALETADGAIQADVRIQRALRKLKLDTELSVRDAAAWFAPPASGSAESTPALTPTEQVQRIREAVLGAEIDSHQEALMILVRHLNELALSRDAAPPSGQDAGSWSRYLNDLASMRTWLAEMDRAQAIQERPFVSNAPVIGPLIVRLRTWWNWMSTKWYILPMVQQQNQFNAATRRAVRQLVTEVELLSLAIQDLRAQIETRDRNGG